MANISDTDASKDFGSVLDRVREGSRVVVYSAGEPAAVVVPPADLQLLALLENELEDEWAREAVAKALKKGGKPIPADKVWKSLGL